MIKRYLKMLCFVVLYIGIYYAVQVIVASILGMQVGIIGALFGMNEAEITSAIIDYTGVFGIVITFVVFLLISKARSKNIFEVCRFRRINMKTAGICVVAGIALNFALILPLELLSSFPAFNQSSESLNELMSTAMGGNAILALLNIGIMGPIIEEIMTRGLVFNELRSNMPVIPAVILQGVLFGVFHMNLFQGTYAAVIGIILGLVYVWTKNIWAPISIHIAINTMSLMLTWMKLEPMLQVYNIMLFIVFSVTLVFTMLLLKRDGTRVKASWF